MKQFYKWPLCLKLWMCYQKVFVEILLFLSRPFPLFCQDCYKKGVPIYFIIYVFIKQRVSLTFQHRSFLWYFTIFFLLFYFIEIYLSNSCLIFSTSHVDDDGCVKSEFFFIFTFNFYCHLFLWEMRFKFKIQNYSHNIKNKSLFNFLRNNLSTV